MALLLMLHTQIAAQDLQKGVFMSMPICLLCAHMLHLHVIIANVNRAGITC